MTVAGSVTTSVQLCVQHDQHDSVRRAGSSATAETWRSLLIEICWTKVTLALLTTCP